MTVLVLTGCEQNIQDNSRLKPFEEESFFTDGGSARPLPQGTLARGRLKENTVFFTGQDENGELASLIPVPVSRKFLERGEERFNIYCAVCHSRTGDGNGIVVQRGFSRPPSYHTERLRQLPAGHFFQVMTDGFGKMAPYHDVLNEEDRWAIVAYIRSLQRSQQSELEEAPPEIQEKLKNMDPANHGAVYE